jgi:hypothetical protein
MHPFSALLWGAGLITGLRAADREGRAFVWIFAVALAVFLLTRAKPYYLAPAYPPLFALGAIAWERWLSSPARRAGLVCIQVGTGLATTIFTLPFFSLPETDAMVDHLLGRVVPPVALTYDLHDEFGWRELAQATAAAVQQLPVGERDRIAIVTANYGEAAAINYFGAGLGLPRGGTGHMNFYLWGPPSPPADILVAIGLDQQWLLTTCASLTLAGESDHPLALPLERHLPIHICRGLRAPWPALWPTLRRFHHGLPPAPRH